MPVGVHADSVKEMAGYLWRRMLFTLLVAAIGTSAVTAHTDEVHELEGIASWYGGKFQGRLTANGELFDTGELTAAHKTLPFGTIVDVRNVRNDLTVRVRINDRGPFVEGRVIDLSRAAADVLQMAGRGVAPVQLSIVSLPEPPRRSVQIASFSRHDAAAQLVNRLNESLDGVHTQVEIVEVNGGSVHRVVVREVPDEAVPEVVSQLEQLGFDSVLVRSR